MLHHLVSPHQEMMQFKKLYVAGGANSYSHKYVMSELCGLTFIVLSSLIIVLSSCDPASATSTTRLPTPTLTPSPTTANDVIRLVRQYEGDILTGDDDSAYLLLSSDQMSRISRQQFAKDMNYTLMLGCWTIVQEVPPSLKKDGGTWEMGLVMEYVAYGGKTMQSYYWHFQVRKEHGKLVVIGIGLLGTSAGNPVISPCTWQVKART